MCNYVFCNNFVTNPNKYQKKYYRKVDNTFSLLVFLIKKIYNKTIKNGENNMYKFNVQDATEKCIKWIQEFFEKNGPTCNAVLGISGGKDSSIVAALCVAALGKDRVIGVLMPNGEQYDIADSYGICDFLGIKYHVVNIKDSYEGLVKELKKVLKMFFQRKEET